MNRRAASNDNILIRTDRDGFAVEEDGKLLRVVDRIEQAVAIRKAFEEVNARFLGQHEPVSNVRFLQVDKSRFLTEAGRA